MESSYRFDQDIHLYRAKIAKTVMRGTPKGKGRHGSFSFQHRHQQGTGLGKHLTNPMVDAPIFPAIAL
jgi:hypothetical protein